MASPHALPWMATLLKLALALQFFHSMVIIVIAIIVFSTLASQWSHSLLPQSSKLLILVFF
jgi:hypothetical protein